MSEAVRVEAVRHAYGPVQALDGLTFAAVGGRITGLLGRNGAGKTTTLELCEGLRPLQSGVVEVLGRSPWRAGADHRSRVGVLLQEGGIPPDARVGSMLRHAGRLFARAADPAELAEELGIANLLGRSFRSLSGGQRRSAAIACALVGRPEVLLLDEPTTGLDPASRRLVWDAIRRRAAEGAAVIWSTHAMDEAQQVADLVVIIDRGRVLAQGEPSDLMADAPVREFNGPANLDLQALRRDTSVALDITEVSPGRYVLSGDIGPRAVAAVTSWCADQGFVPEGLTTTSRTLEDVFLDLTGGAQ